MNIKKIILIAFVSLVMISCSTKIQTIMTKIDKFDGEEVRIKGVVENPTNLNIVKFFFINDDSGKKMRVITKNALPKEGEKKKIKGKVVQRFKIGTFQWVVLKEIKKE